MTQAKIGSISGAAFAQVWRNDLNGYAMGQLDDPNVPGTDVTTHALLLHDFISADIPSPERATASFRGGDRWRGSVFFGIGEYPAFPLTVQDLNAVFQSLCTGAKADQTTNAKWTVGAPDYNRVLLPSMGLMLAQRFTARDAGIAGRPRWLNMIFPEVTIGVTLPSAMFQGQQELTCQVAPVMVDKWPNGDAFDAETNLYESQTPVFYIVTDYPLAITTYVADGIETTFTTAYLPKYENVTVNDTNNHFAIAGVPTALTSIVAATGVATMAAAGDSGDIGVLMYETEFETA